MTTHELIQKASCLTTSPNDLQSLSTHTSELVRAAVASNPNTNKITLLSLVGEKSTHVIEQLNKNESDFTDDSYEFTATKNSKLSIITTADAEFIISLRKNPKLNKHLSYVETDIDKQKDWINDYKKREARRTEFYFVIRCKNNERLGAIRAYDFKQGSFCWGSWIINPDSPRKTAIESAINIYEFGFNVLGFSQSHFDVRNNNSKVIDFHKRMGAKIISVNEVDTFFIMQKNYYVQSKADYKNFLITE